ncbi:GNAT family N-acetyltransferase [Nocardioides sp.]|uniref:GNAT family N-acetyltransferase n=1 Tax=Nocardioides sp. TaxID=35761 RepID=UPI00260715DA|nr:GNAT family N-acetyltransferase [Nocardioides sp.]
MRSERLRTQRLSLPLWDARDVAAIRGQIARSPHWHPEFPRPDDVAAATLWHEGDPWGPRSIVRGVTTLGSIGFFGPPEPAADGVAEVEVGYGLVSQAHGYGFATEALAAMVAAAEALGVRVRASVEATNQASVRVLAKAGFTQLRGANENGELVMVRPLARTGATSAPAAPSVGPRLSFEIRSTTEDDWPALAAFRVENATEHPISYGATVETVLEFTEDDWRMRAARGDREDAACLVALQTGTERWLGMMQCQLGDEHGTTPVLTGVYVTKSFRGKRYGVADRLLEQIVAWAGAHGPELRLWVFEGSEPALRFYRRHGFAPTGRTQPLTLDPSLGVLRELSRRL